MTMTEQQMTHTFGAMPTTMPRGYFKAVQFPVLAMLDTKTGDRRMLLSEGADVRNLPLSIKFTSVTGFGHDGADVSGALFEVTLDPANNLMSGKGFLLDDDLGHRHARLIATGAMRGNSVDLAEVRGQIVQDDTGEEWIEFTKFKLAATTGVSTPAFAEAHATVDELTDEEMMASLGDPMAPLVAQAPTEFFVNVIGESDIEVTASGSQLAPFAAFYTPEANKPQKVVVTADHRVYGHLALWQSCHDGFTDKCLMVPRPSDGYASFNKPGPLTERGQVETGPIFAFGGHRSAKSAKTIADAYGGIENSWCDVRVTEGVHGPWLSGVVRPGITDDVVYAARASRISGHWVNGRLKAIVSVNAEGYEVPGSGPERELVAGFAFATHDDEVTELVASFPECATPAPENQMTISFTPATSAASFTQALGTAISTAGPGVYWSVAPSIGGGGGGGGMLTSGGVGGASSPVLVPVEEVIEVLVETSDDLRTWADERLADILSDERDE